VCRSLERRADKRLAKLVERTNSRRGPLQPLLTLRDAQPNKSKGVLGVEKIFDTAFASRPKSPEKSHRLYAFGSKENKLKYYQSSSILYAAYTEASEQYRSGRYDMTFPAGMYRPTVSMAA
jgi:hypothetical protein